MVWKARSVEWLASCFKGKDILRRISRRKNKRSRRYEGDAGYTKVVGCTRHGEGGKVNALIRPSMSSNKVKTALGMAATIGNLPDGTDKE